MEQQSTAVPHTDRRFTTEDFRNLFSYARHGKYKQVSCHRQQTRHLFVNLIILFIMLCVFAGNKKAHAGIVELSVHEFNDFIQV